MARSKKSRFTQEVMKAEARDRKRGAQRRMRVSGKGVFLLGRLSSSQAAKRKSSK